MPGKLRCDALVFGDGAFLKDVPTLLTNLVSRSRRYQLEVKGKYYFSIPEGPVTSGAGWYIICNSAGDPLYVGTAENLNKRLNSNTGSIDNFANSKRTSDPERNFIKAFASAGLFGSLSVVVIPEAELRRAVGLEGPLSERDRCNVEKCLSILRVEVLAHFLGNPRATVDP